MRLHHSILAAVCLWACSSDGTVSEQAKGAAIVAGCKYGLEAVEAPPVGDAAPDAATPADVAAVKAGCEAELRAWRTR